MIKFRRNFNRILKKLFTYFLLFFRPKKYQMMELNWFFPFLLDFSHRAGVWDFRGFFATKK